MATTADRLLGVSHRAFAAVLFDLDGTLVDSTGVVERSWLALADEIGLEPSRLTGFHGVPARGILEVLLPVHQRASALARIIEIEVADTEGIVMLPGAERALRELAGAPVAIATSCTAVLAAARIAAARVAAPTVLVTVDDVERGKPAPDPFLEAAARLGVAPELCLVVEDAPSGLEAARAAGCATLAVATTSGAAELQADAVVATLDEVRWTVDDDGIHVHASGVGPGTVAGAGDAGKIRPEVGGAP